MNLTRPLEWLKSKVRDRPALNRLSKFVLRYFRAYTTAYPNWRKVGGIADSFPSLTSRKKILIATSVGSHLPGTTLESLIAAALKVRGAEVHVFLCDSVLPACLGCEYAWFSQVEQFVREGPQKSLCNTCFSPANKMFSDLGVQIHRYSEHLSPGDWETVSRISKGTEDSDISEYKLEGLSIGEHALAGTLRFFAKASIDDEPQGASVLRRYFEAALLTTFATRNLLGKVHFDAAVFHHGIYVPQGLIGEVARNAKVRVVNWNPAYRKQSFIFSHDDTYHHTLMWEPVERWQNMLWTAETEVAVVNYLQSRWHGTQDWIWFHDRPNFDVDAIYKTLGLDRTKPCVGMLTNVMWDAQLHYPANAFPNMLDWVVETIEYFSKRLDVQLIIRVHPAEVRGALPSRQPVVAEIRNRFPVLPKNVFVIGPESDISTYTLAGLCDSVIIYGTKTGVELTSMGIPTVVAGEAWIRNKGLTLDATSRESYLAILDQLPLGKKMAEKQILLAKKYAFHFFLRRMIPLELTVPTTGWPPYRLDLQNMNQLKQGESVGLDVICDGILTGSDFIYPAEQFISERSCVEQDAS